MRIILAYVLCGCLAVLVGCSSSGNKDSVTPDVRTTIVDKYWCPEMTGLVVYYFKSDGTYKQSLADDKTKSIAYGTWTLSNNVLKLIDKSGAGVDTDITLKNLTTTSVTLDTTFGGFGYKVCQ